MVPNLPFADLINRLQDGDPDGTCLIFDCYVKRLVCLAGAYLPRILLPKLDPEDVVQSVFRSFFKRQQEGRFVLENWDELWNLLAVLTVRKCGQHIDHFQAARRDVRRESAFVETSSLSARSGLAVAPAPTPLEAVLLAEMVAAVLQGVRPEQRRVVQMRLEGYTIEEISQELRCTERTVYRVLERVRVDLEPASSDSVGS